MLKLNLFSVNNVTFIGKFSSKRAMRPLVIIKIPVIFYNFPCFIDATKFMHIKTFFPQFAYETLNIAIFPWTSFWYKFLLHSISLKKHSKFSTSEFWSIVCSYYFWFVIFKEIALKNFNYRIGTNRIINFNSDTESNENIT